MKTRALQPEDIEKIRKLHENFYSDLEFPDFLNNFLCGFVVTDDKDDIIVAGGVQPIGEIILVTDKDKNRIKIGKALREAQRISLYLGSRFNLDELIAFVKDNEYASHLVKHGFHPRSSAFSIKVPTWGKISRDSNSLVM
jgi:hypothetical protein